MATFRKIFFPIVLLLVFLSDFQIVSGQRERFSGDPYVFPDEVFDLLKGNMKEEEEIFIRTFLDKWVDSVYTTAEMDQIMAIANNMYLKKARTRPHLYAYIEALDAFLNAENSKNNYRVWEEGLVDLLAQKKVLLRDLGRYLEFPVLLLREDFLYQSRSARWRASGAEVTFSYNKELVIDVNSCDLIGFSRDDSIVIHNTDGLYYPMQFMFSGNKGTVDWQRAAIPADDVYAKLDRYSIDMQRSYYTADTVMFVNKYYFDEPLLGTLEEKVENIPDPTKAKYPQFNSYLKIFEIRDFFPGINYIGGFAMEGANLVGKGTDDERAQLTVYQNDTLRMRVNSNFFQMDKERVVGFSSDIKFYFQQDSIYHPEMTFAYTNSTRNVTITPSEKYLSSSPYLNSYHNMYMTFNRLTWKIGERNMYFSGGANTAVGNAVFESVNYFNQRDFEAMQGMGFYHPLAMLLKYSKGVKSNVFFGESYAKFINQSHSSTRHILMNLAMEGFIAYNFDMDEVTIRPKLIDHLKASLGRIDYDVIQLRSITESPLENGSLDIENLDLRVNGVEHIFVSDSQNVHIYPTNNQITLKRNRSFQFDGTIQAGLFTFYGHNFFFNYDSFHINLQNVDSLQIRAFTGEVNEFGFPVSREIPNIIEHITGLLVIDKPDNKSGRESYSEYPLFTSRENSFIYYDDPWLEGGVYPSRDFYFELYPYLLDSLDNFNKSGLQFDGLFVSSGIFPDIEQKLVVQNDYSLGFTHVTDSAGLPLYGGKGNYYKQIELTNKGLRGNGRLTYLASEAQSDVFKFYPDSMNTHANTFSIRKQSSGTLVPEMTNNAVNIHWEPYNDILMAEQTTNAFQILNDSTTLTGQLALEPSGLSGSGMLDMKNAYLTSNNYNFRDVGFTADTADLNLRSLNKAGLTVQTTNVKADVDFGTQVGNFGANEDFTLVEFPENKYISYLDYFEWKMRESNLEMGARKKLTPEIYNIGYQSPEDHTLSGARFVSVQYDQDSLSFVSPVATYDYSKNVINAPEVQFIPVADALIYPKNGEVSVLENGKLSSLDSAIIIANNREKYHRLHTASIQIESSKEYTGEAYYDYVDELDEVQLIYFSDVKVDTGLHTVARGAITEPDNFTLSPYFAYQGKVRLDAYDSLLFFEGGARIVQECENISTGWLGFATRIYPREIFIPVAEQPKDINFNKTFAGTFITQDSVHVYSSFMGSRKQYNDNYIATAKGYLTYNKYTATYEIAEKEKIADRNIPGNYLALDRDNCVIKGEGKLDLGVDLGQLKLLAIGNSKHDLISDEKEVNVVLGMNFLLNQPSLNEMASEVDSLPGLQPTDIQAKLYQRALNELIGASASEKLNEELKLFGEIKELPEPLTQTILFSDITLKWNQASNSYQSVGKIGIASINGRQIHKKVGGLLEITKKRSGDVLDLYLEIDRRNWYYFGYTRGVMQVQSSNIDFYNPIKELKAKDREMDTKRGETSYLYMLATDRKLSLFRQKYQEMRNALPESDPNAEGEPLP